MATNKRKDAAALFELIDRSTLKVPKNAGALKIPSWWSSKTNPSPSSTDSPPTSRPPSPTTPSAVARAAPSPNAPAAEQPERKVPPKPAPKPQPKLFEPPPTDVEPGVSPSIRPPTTKAAVPTAPALKSPPPASAPAEETDFKSTEPISEQDLPPDVPPLDALDEKAPARPARVFAPQTYAQDRKPWSPPRSGSFARLPAWVLLSGMAAVVILISIFIWAVKRTNTATANPSSPTATHSSPAPANGRSGVTSLIPNTSGPHPAGNPPEPGHAGTVYDPGVRPHYADQYYVVICSTPSQKVAQIDAKWVADGGIDVSWERTTQAGKSMFMVLTVQGFPSSNAAQPWVNQIKLIGDAHEKGAFAKAFPRSGMGLPATQPSAAAPRAP